MARLVRLASFEPAFAVGPEGRARAEREFMTLIVDEPSDGTRGGTSYVCRATTTTGRVIALKRLRPLDAEGDPAWLRSVEAGRRRAFFEEYRNQLNVAPLQGFPKLYGFATVVVGPGAGDGAAAAGRPSATDGTATGEPGTASGAAAADRPEPTEPAILMEWVEGITLRDATCRLPQEGAGVASDVVAAVGISVLEVLEGAARLDARLVHRDISPRNIMFRTHERTLAEQVASGRFDVVLIDFGSSTTPRPQDGSLTQQAGIWRNGTPEYAPPEMLTNDIAAVEGLRSAATIDVYALCSVLYELYSGRTPFELARRGGLSFYRAKTELPLADLEPRHPEDAALTDAIMSGIRGTQAARPEASQLLASLRAWQAGGDASAAASSQTARTQESGTAAAAGQATTSASSASSQVTGVATTLTQRPPRVASPASPASAKRRPDDRPMARRAFVVGAAACALAAGGAVAARALGMLGGQGTPGKDAAETTSATSPASAAAQTEATSDAASEAASSAGSTALDPATVLAKDPSTGLWGLASPDGSWVVRPQFSDVSGTPSSRGTAVRDEASGLWGFVSADGAWAAQPAFAAVGEFADADVAPAQDPGTQLWGLIDASGAWTLQPTCIAMGSRVSQGLVAARTDSREDTWGYLATDGSWAARPEGVTLAGPFGADGLAAARKGETLWGYLATDGSWAIKPTLFGATAFSEGLAFCRPDGASGPWVCIDASGARQFETGATEVRPVSSGVAAAKDAASGLWGFLDASGWRLGPAYAELGDLSEGVAAAKDAESGLWGVLALDGTWKVRPTFADVSLASV